MNAAAAPPVMLKGVAEGVYGFSGVHELMSASNAGAICNIAVIVGGDSVAVVDSGGSVGEAKLLLDAIKAVTDRPVRYLINTHMHPDHVFGNAVFRDIGATLIGHRKLPLALAGRAEQYLTRFRQQMGEDAMRGVEIVVPTQLIEDGIELDLGGRKLELKAWQPAHTDNDLTVLDLQTKTLCAGDLVFVDHVPTLDGSLVGWLKQTEELAAIKAVRVIPGHGPVSGWPQALDGQTRYLTVLADDLRKAIAEGRPLSEAVETVGQSEREKWALFGEYHGRNATTAFAELEWE
ncbi:MAG: quinoprotein relay system zinc metallohydrolase 2 [Aestuariivirga sp.]